MIFRPGWGFFSRVVSLYSGGINSYMATRRLIYEYDIPPDMITGLFNDTLTEDQDLYRFIFQTSQHLGIEVAWQCEGRDIWQVMHDERFLGNSRLDPCSRILKRENGDRWIAANCRPRDTILCFGIDWSESERCVNIKRNMLPFRTIFPLCDLPYMPYTRYFELCEEDGIRVPRLYDLGFTHNNCGGFCVKAGKAHFKRLLETLPERYAYHEMQEQNLLTHIGKHGVWGLLRHSQGGIKYYITLKQFRLMLESGTVDINDVESDVGHCGCFTV